MSDLKPEQTEDGVRIPQNVLAQVQEADRLQEALVKGEQLINNDDTAADDLSQGNAFDGTQEDDLEHPATKQQAAEISAMTPEQLAEELRQAQHKFSVLQGKYNKEVKEVVSKAPAPEISELKKELSDMKNMIAAMAMTRSVQGQEAQQATQGAVGNPDIDSLNDEDFADYGDEMKTLVKAVKALAQKNGQNIPESDILQNITSRLERTEQVVAQTESQKFFNRLTDEVPAWRAINKEPEWLDFLKSAEPMTGVPYQVILADAQQKGDVERIKRVFGSFPKFQDYDAYHRKQLGIPPQNGGAQRQKAAYVEPSAGGGVNHPSARGADLGRRADTVSKEQLEKASRDFTGGRLTEQEFDKIANLYQKQLSEQIRIQQARQRKGPGLGV